MRANTLPAETAKTPGRFALSAVKSLLLVASAIFSASVAWGQKLELLPSTPAGVDCTWKPFDSPSLGLKMLVQECAAPDRQYIFRTQGNAIYYRAKAGEQAGREQKIIEIFAKSVDTPAQNAIYQRFVAPSQTYRNAGCEVRDIRDLLFLGREQITYDIFPIGQYGYPSELNDNGDTYSVCGDYGFKADNSRFFSFHPDEDKSKYLFISMPANKSLFDPLSILLYPVALKNGTMLTTTAAPTAPSPKPTTEAPEPMPQLRSVEITDWRTVQRNGGMNYFVNSHAVIDAATGYLSSELLVDTGPRASAQNLAGLPDGAASKIERVTIDCKTRRYKTDNADLYRENMGKGAVVRHFDQRAGWSYAPAHYVTIFDKLCQPRD